MSLRAQKISSLIKRVLSSEISRLANENSAGFASISTVKMSKDLSVANIYFNLLNSKLSSDDFTAILNDSKGKLRSIVASEIRMRMAPELRFFYDDTLEQMEATKNLLDEVKKKSPYQEDYGDTSVYEEKILKKLDEQN